VHRGAAAVHAAPQPGGVSRERYAAWLHEEGRDGRRPSRPSS